MSSHPALILFLALFGLYSPVAALASYLPIVRPFGNAQITRLSLGLAFNVAVFVLAALWVGEPLLKLLGISTAALTATGGIALAYAAIPLMRGKAGAVEEVERRISLQGAMILDRVAGILLTAIAVILLANGFTDLVVARLNR